MGILLIFCGFILIDYPVRTISSPMYLRGALSLEGQPWWLIGYRHLKSMPRSRWYRLMNMRLVGFQGTSCETLQAKLWIQPHLITVNYYLQPAWRVYYGASSQRHSIPPLQLPTCRCGGLFPTNSPVGS